MSADQASHSVIHFLEELQSIRERIERLRQSLAGRGLVPRPQHTVLSGRGFQVHCPERIKNYRGCISLGFLVHGMTGLEYDIGLSLMWDDGCWTIGADVWVETADGGQEIVNSVPECSAVTMDELVSRSRESVDALGELVRLVE